MATQVAEGGQGGLTMVVRIGGRMTDSGGVWPAPPRIEVRLSVGGDVDPADVTQTLGMVPSPRAGGERGPTRAGAGAVEERWGRLLAARQTWDIDPLLARATSALEPLAASIARLRELQPGVWVGLVAVAYVDSDHPRAAPPNLALEPKLLGRLADLGLDVVVDYRLLDRVPRAD